MIEYFNKISGNFFIKGMMHQSSCDYTPLNTKGYKCYGLISKKLCFIF